MFSIKVIKRNIIANNDSVGIIAPITWMGLRSRNEIVPAFRKAQAIAGVNVKVAGKVMMPHNMVAPNGDEVVITRERDGQRMGFAPHSRWKLIPVD